MWQGLRKYLTRSKRHWYRRRLEYALALTGRGEVRRDGLRLDRIRSRLEIQWRARDIHPWDRDSPPEKRAQILLEQALADTEEAISRLFEALPEVDVIELAVIQPASEGVMLAGTVERSAWSEKPQHLSVKMRLQEMGVGYRLAGSYFEIPGFAGW
jgi:hypothetical protein